MEEDEGWIVNDGPEEDANADYDAEEEVAEYEEYDEEAEERGYGDEDDY